MYGHDGKATNVTMEPGDMVCSLRHAKEHSLDPSCHEFSMTRMKRSLN